MKSFVLARKGVLASNPDVAKMSRLQWAMEYYAIRQMEIDNTKTQKRLLMNVLGLDLMPPRSEGAIIVDPTEDEILSHFSPLIMWLGDEGRLQTLREALNDAKVVSDLQKEGVEADHSDYEDMVAHYERLASGSIGMDDTDIEPFIPMRMDAQKILQEADTARAVKAGLVKVVGDGPSARKIKFEEQE